MIESMTTARAKPVGTYGAERTAPPWATFGMLASFADDDTVRRAVARSELSAFKWVVQFGFDQPLHATVESAYPATVSRLARLGLFPHHVAAVTYGEEWEERRVAGDLSAYGDDLTRETLTRWLGRQYDQLKLLTGKPVMHVAALPDGMPSTADYLGLMLYPYDGEDPLDALAPRLLHAEAHTHRPLVLIGRGFRNESSAQGGGWQRMSTSPSLTLPSLYTLALGRPSVAALLWFLWESRPGVGLTGIADMPTFAERVASAMATR